MWAGATLQVPHRAMIAQRGIPPEGVYVGYFAYANLRLGFARGMDSTAPSGVQTYTVLSSAF